MSNISLAIQVLGETTHPHLLNLSVSSSSRSYEAMVASWRDPSVAIPTKQEVEEAGATFMVTQDWKDAMKATDTDMPRWLENHIEHSHGGVADNDYQQAAYDEKKKLRGQKP